MIGVDGLIGLAVIVALLLIGMVLIERVLWRCPLCNFYALGARSRRAHMFAHMIPREERK